MRRRTVLQGLGSAMAIAGVGCVPPPTPSREQGLVDTSRVLQRLTARSTVDGAGATLRRLFPAPELRNLDPFVLLDDFDVRRPAGFPDHPHRGFEAFTYMITGAFHHRDSLGNDSVIGPGGTQRFTSGRGARHSEMPATDGSNRGLQLWVNLPRRLKAIAPSYVGTQGDAMPSREQLAGRIREVVGGESPVELQTEVEYLDLELSSRSGSRPELLADAAFSHSIPDGHNAVIYVIEGRVGLLGETLERGQAILPSPGRITLRSEGSARVLWLSGRPHGEPIRHRGPFVD